LCGNNVTAAILRSESSVVASSSFDQNEGSPAKIAAPQQLQSQGWMHNNGSVNDI
jgi:hypothetical protein